MLRAELAELRLKRGKPSKKTATGNGEIGLFGLLFFWGPLLGGLTPERIVWGLFGWMLVSGCRLPFLGFFLGGPLDPSGFWARREREAKGIRAGEFLESSWAMDQDD